MTLSNTPAPFIYQAFGLTLSSEIAFPELFVPDSTDALSPDVVIRLGKAPAKESIAGTQKPFSAYDATEFWHINPNIAVYYVKDGKEIVVEPLGGSDADIRLFFLSNALSALLYQRDMIPLHASGVMDETGGVYLFTAPSRTGKSTTLYALTQMGYLPFTDDVCVLQPDADAVYAVASWPVMKLWADALKKIDVTDTSEHKRLRPALDKYGLYFHEYYLPEPAKVKGIIVLQEDRNGTEIGIERLSALEAFKAVEKNAYRRRWVEGMGRSVSHFKHAGLLANQVPVYLAKRPGYQNTIREFAAAIQEKIFSGQLPVNEQNHTR